MTHKWDVRFLQLARLVAGWSKDPSTQVGAVIVRPNRTIASLGYNGFPRRMTDKDERLEDREEKLRRIVHAEMNAVLQAAERLDGYTLYGWPLLPCERCAVHLLQAGIGRVVAPALSKELAKRWADHLASSKEYFLEAGVEVVTIPRKEIG